MTEDAPVVQKRAAPPVNNVEPPATSQPPAEQPGTTEAGENLIDKLQIGEAPQQRRTNFRAFSYENQHLRIFQTDSKFLHILDVIVPNGNIMSCQFFKTFEGTQSVKIVIQYGNF